jgi:GTPase SAR1 family protein
MENQLTLNFGIQVCVSIIFFLETNLHIFILAGQEKFDNIHQSYFHQAHACIMVYNSLSLLCDI